MNAHKQSGVVDFSLQASASGWNEGEVVEIKYCECCGKNFMRAKYSDDRFCAKCHGDPRLLLSKVPTRGNLSRSYGARA